MSKKKIKVFYNKSCKLCKTEINHYKKHSDNSFLWIDIIDNDHAIKTTSKSLKQLIRRIHVIKDGQLLEGASAFLEIWKNIPTIVVIQILHPSVAYLKIYFCWCKSMNYWPSGVGGVMNWTMLHTPWLQIVESIRSHIHLVTNCVFLKYQLIWLQSKSRWLTKPYFFLYLFSNSCIKHGNVLDIAVWMTRRGPGSIVLMLIRNIS